MILYDAIMYKYPKAVPKKDFVLRNDGSGSYIEEWNLRTPIPTEEELQLWWEESKSTPPYEPPDQSRCLHKNCRKKSWPANSLKN